MSDVTIENIPVDGMSCGHCINAVRDALLPLEGVTVREIKLGEAHVAYEAGKKEAIVEAIEEAGYTVP